MPRKSTPNRLRFTRSSLASLPAPPKGGRVICICDDKPYLKLRATPTAKTFYYQRTVRGRQETVTIGQFPDLTVAQAKDAADAINARNTLGESVQSARRAKRDEFTLAEVWEHYREHRKRKREGADSSSLQNQWDRYLSRWANKRLSDLDPDEAQRFIFKVRAKRYRAKDARGKQRLFGGPVQANRVQRMGKAMYAHAAAEMRWRGENPFAFSQKSEQGRRRDRRLTKAEVRRLMDALPKVQNQSAADLFRMCIFSGQRVGNVKAMRYADVDLETGGWRVGRTKTGTVHRITLSSKALELVAGRRKAADSPYVFPGRRGHLKEYKKSWAKVCELADLEDVTVHDLRHLSATQEHEARVLEAIRQRLGHSHASMTESYIHATTDLERAMRDAALTEYGL